jgi:hypothetical protein
MRPGTAVTTAISEMIVIFSGSRALQLLLGYAPFVQMAGNANISRRPFSNLLLCGLVHHGVFVVSYGRRDLPPRCQRWRKRVRDSLKLTRTCVRTAVSLPFISDRPKPGIAFGSLKSHWFSAMPIKSRMAGSLVHAFRSAALVNSLGTRLAEIRGRPCWQ